MDERGGKPDFRVAETTFMSEASGNLFEGDSRAFLKRSSFSLRNGGAFPGFPPEVDESSQGYSEKEKNQLPKCMSF